MSARVYTEWLDRIGWFDPEFQKWLRKGEDAEPNEAFERTLRLEIERWKKSKGILK